MFFSIVPGLGSCGLVVWVDGEFNVARLFLLGSGGTVGMG